MTATNDITGDSLVSKSNSKEFRENYDKIFNKKKCKDCTRCEKKVNDEEGA
jgi:hypothetical protein